MKRNSPIIVKKITENSKKNNKDKQIQFHIWKIKVKPNTDDRKTNTRNTTIIITEIIEKIFF
jgi:hypothetical protein